MVLQSRAGTQHAPVQRWCAGHASDGSAFSLCGATHFDTFGGPLPTMSVVRPGERIRIAVAGAQSVGLSIRPSGCPDAAPRRVALGANGRWRVDLPRGRYRLEAVVPHFTVGRTAGHTSASFGIWVDRRRKLEVVVQPRAGAC
jgi:hypothetical protein